MTTLKLGDAVLVWMGTGPMGLPFAAKVIGEGDPPWLDLNINGQHLPQKYHLREIELLTSGHCAAYGLCANCYGYGSTGETAPLAAAVDQIPDPCGDCGGTGRPVMRVHISRQHGTTEARMEVLPHAVLVIDGNPNCMACGFPQDHEMACHI